MLQQSETEMDLLTVVGDLKLDANHQWIRVR